MQRQPTSVNFTITLQLKRRHHDPDSVSYENICTPAEFATNYQQIFKERNSMVDACKNEFPAPVFTVAISGEMNGKPFTKNFARLEAYREFLVRHKLLSTAPSILPAMRII